MFRSALWLGQCPNIALWCSYLCQCQTPQLLTVVLFWIQLSHLTCTVWNDAHFLLYCRLYAHCICDNNIIVFTLLL